MEKYVLLQKFYCIFIVLLLYCIFICNYYYINNINKIYCYYMYILYLYVFAIVQKFGNNYIFI